MNVEQYYKSESYITNGFIIIPQILNSQEVSQYRQLLGSHFIG